MVWSVKFKSSAEKEIYKLDRQWQEAILNELDEISSLVDPKSRGKPLRGEKKGFWRYRVGDYRILCHIHEEELIVLVVSVGHRKKIYDS